MCIYRMLEAVCDLAPDIYPLSTRHLLHQHFFGEVIPSGRLKVYNKETLWDLFSSASLSTMCTVTFSFMMYLDDVSLGGLMSMEYVELLKLHHLLTCPPLQPWQT